MIEDWVRELVAGMAAVETRTLAEQVDDVAELERSAAMVLTALSERSVAFAETRRRKDRDRGASTDEAGRGAAVELALARRVSKWTIDNQLGYATILIQDFPQLLAACRDGRVSQAAAKNIVQACEPLTPQQRRGVDAELTVLAMEQTPGQVTRSAARTVAALDPDAAATKAKAARPARWSGRS